VKIVQLLPELNEGGVERGTVELGRELVKQGFESVVISNGGKLVKQLESEGSLHVKFDVCSKNPLSAVNRVLGLRKILKKLDADVLHVRSRVPAWLVYFANKTLGIPVVATVHGFNSVSSYSRIMTKADKIICVSGSIKNYIQKHYDAPENKITIIPRGIDLEKFNPANLDAYFITKFKKEYNLEKRFVVTTVGRITQLKDLETFIKTIAIVQKSLPNAIGLIVGGVREDKQNYFESLKSLIKSLHVEVLFTGSQANVAEIYSLSDVVTSSSKKPESFGRSVAEALALNTPVIATNHGGVLDIIKENINGYFVEIGDEKEFAKKILQAKELKFDGYDYVKENFSLEQMVEKTIGIYKSFKNNPIILMYHSVDNQKLKRLRGIRVPLRTFEKQIKYLSDNGYRSFTLAQMIEEKDNLPKKSVVITFDDGYKDNLANALPILKKYNFKATIFIVINRFNNDWALYRKKKNANIVNHIEKLTDADIETLLKSNLIEIGAHTLNHKNFSKISDKEKIEEISKSKTILEKKFDIECKTFSYPFGIYESTDKKIVEDIGFIGAVSTQTRKVDLEKDSLFLLPRLNVKNEYYKFIRKLKKI